MALSDVLVVGGGVIGASVTVACGLRGAITTCLDVEEQTARAASKAAGAMLGVFGEVTCEARALADRRETEFRLRSADAYSEWINVLRQWSSVPVRLKSGTLIVANICGKADLGNIEAIFDEAVSYRQNVEWLDIGKEYEGLRPHRHHGPTKALFLPNEKYVDARQLLCALHEAIAAIPRTSHQVRWVSAILHNDCQVTGVRTTCGEEISAPIVVLCAGVGLNDILFASGLKNLGLPRILGGKGSAAMLGTTCRLPYVIRTPNRDFACGTHAVPLGGELVYVGATNRISNTPGLAAGVTAGEIHAQLHSVIHEINVGFRQAVLRSTFSGFRPLSADGYPLIGATSLEGLYVATGTYRNGVLMAPLIADIIACAVTGSGAEAPINPFAPLHRAELISAPQRESLLERGVNDLISFIQEPHGLLPYNRQRELSDLLFILFRQALDGGDDEIVRQFRQAFDASPMPELVPWLMYEANAAREKQRGK